MMTQMSQTTNDLLEEKRRRVDGNQAAATDEKERLQFLVGELLSENQKLRFENEGLRERTERLQRQAQSAESGLAHATKWAGMVL
jgi:regulator of replication initiation timing